ncbi:MAG: restriction endonuclease subunit S [Bdellovibrionales bacterium]|jgi:restriction endonuclease S subunit|nr:restriction endonuclease subunit S [Bdellovibrionales bacterium]MBT3525952.1 restriction endonuclease subunit S [Bdellovibrionales bacterium]
MKLREIIDIKAGYSIRGRIEQVKKDEGDLKLLQMKNVDSLEGIDYEGLISIKFQGKKEPDYLTKGDVLFVGRGSKFFSVCIEKALENIAAAPQFLILRTKNESVIPEYVSWYINHKRAQAYFRREAAGTAVTHVSKASLEELVIEVPSIEEQKRIVKINNLIIEEKKITQTLLLKRSQLVEQILDNKIED